MSTITLDKLSKRYGHNSPYALNDVSLSVEVGEVYGFLGANGAGKSTAIRTLLNFLQPTSGTATILGKDIVRDSVELKRHIGYLSGDVALYPRMRGGEFLRYMVALQPLPHPAYLDTLVADFQVDLTKRIGELSKGNRQKIGILQALMHEPDVLILDEPTSGLDPLMQGVFFDAVLAAKKRGASVFFSSHNLAEVRNICDRVGFIRQGQLVQELRISELEAQAAHSFVVRFAEKVPVGALRQLPHAVVSMGADKHEVNVSVPSNGLSGFFTVLGKYPIVHFQQNEVDLEQVFMQFYRQEEK